MELIIEHSQNHHHQNFSWVLTLCEKSKYEGVLELLKISKIGCNFRAQSDRVETIHRQVYYRMGTLKNLRRDVTFFLEYTIQGLRTRDSYDKETCQIFNYITNFEAFKLPYLLEYAPRRLFNFSCLRCGAYSRAALIRRRRLFKGLILKKQNILIVQFNLLHEYFSWLTGLKLT